MQLPGWGGETKGRTMNMTFMPASTRRTAFVLLTLLTVSFLWYASPAQAAVGDSVSGNYVRHSSVDSRECLRTGYNVQTTASGTTGQYTQVGYRCDGSGYTGNHVSAEITCLVVSGSQATFAGRITSSGGTFAGFTSVRETGFDNSTPTSPVPPDRAGTELLSTGPTCSPAPPLNATVPIDAGDIRVTRGAVAGASIRFIDPTPPDGSVVAAPFILNVEVTSPNAQVALVRYFFIQPNGAMSSANRETESGYAFTVQGPLADVLRRTDRVLVRACAYSVEAPNGDPLACTERTLFVSSG